MTQETGPENPPNGISRRALLSAGAATLALAPFPKAIAQGDGIEALVTLTFAHEYFGQAPLAMKVAPLDPAEFNRNGLRMGQTTGPLVIAQRQGAPRPATIVVQLSTDDRDFTAYTSVDDTPLGADRLYLGNQTAPNTVDIRRMEQAEAQALALGKHSFAVLEIALPEVGTLDLEVGFAATRTLWTYYLKTQTNPLKDNETEYWIEDVDRLYDFANAGTLLDGKGTRMDVFRSTTPIPLSAYPTYNFQLRRVVRTTGAPSTFSIILDRLPGATTRLDLPQPGEPDAALISRMYLSL